MLDTIVYLLVMLLITLLPALTFSYFDYKKLRKEFAMLALFLISTGSLLITMLAMLKYPPEVMPPIIKFTKIFSYIFYGYRQPGIAMTVVCFLEGYLAQLEPSIKLFTIVTLFYFCYFFALMKVSEDQKAKGDSFKEILFSKWPLILIHIGFVYFGIFVAYGFCT